MDFQFNYGRSLSYVDRSCQPKFEKIDHTRPNQDPTAEIKSERLDQMHLMLQRL